ncbi:MAG: cupin-like domain-containing protein, partial [Alphaproteobacteria bacterium]|nr:cupin-like domain-containing protein [Alphaproteobacteria bacterium]
MTSPREIDGTAITGPEQFLRDVVRPCEPVVLRGLVGHWPAVQAALQSPVAFKDYVQQFDNGGQMEAFFGEPRIAGKYYYNDDLKGFNFERKRMSFANALDTIVSTLGRQDSPSIYVGSVVIDAFLPGFTAQNAMPLLGAVASPRIWLGHASNVSTHYDAYENIACVVAGRRRFTLYPPEAIGNLYVGPIDNTMAGQPVSLAASSPPDDGKFPLFREVKDAALTVELLPGDALFLPKLWWHQIEATAPFNGLINYWWDAFSTGPDAPYTSLLLAMI